MLYVQSLNIYPTKSCAGFNVARSLLNTKGLKGDRLMMITTPDGSFLSQRTLPKMASIRLYESGKYLVLEYPNYKEVFESKVSGKRTVTVWRDTISAADLGDPIATKISQYLGSPVRVVRVEKETERFVDPKYTDKKVLFNFADGFPFLITNTQSLDALNEKLAEYRTTPIRMNRFRPNIVISGLKPFQEDSILRLKIGEATFRLVKPCTRCRIIGIDPLTLEEDASVLKTLSAFSLNRALGSGAYFGQNAILESGNGTTITNDDPVEIIEYS